MPKSVRTDTMPLTAWQSSSLRISRTFGFGSLIPGNWKVETNVSQDDSQLDSWGQSLNQLDLWGQSTRLMSHDDNQLDSYDNQLNSWEQVNSESTHEDSQLDSWRQATPHMMSINSTHEGNHWINSTRDDNHLDSWRQSAGLVTTSEFRVNSWRQSTRLMKTGNSTHYGIQRTVVNKLHWMPHKGCGRAKATTFAAADSSPLQSTHLIACHCLCTLLWEIQLQLNSFLSKYLGKKGLL